jgi:hypothetical protein
MSAKRKSVVDSPVTRKKRRKRRRRGRWFYLKAVVCQDGGFTHVC